MSSTYIPAALRRQVIADFDERCAYCHSPEKLLDTLYEIDHIVPKAAEGATTQENLCYACPVCNIYKGDQQYGNDPATGRRVQLFHPRRQQWERHFFWSQDGKSMEGRTSCGRATIVAYQLNHARMIRMRDMWQDLGAYPPDWIRQQPQDKATP